MTLNLNLSSTRAGTTRPPGATGLGDPSGSLDITYYQELARKAEAAKFDSIFFADGPALADNIRYAPRFRLEPFTWMSGDRGVTSGSA